jgi:small-conductance mechanosensitive channel
MPGWWHDVWAFAEAHHAVLAGAGVLAGSIVLGLVFRAFAMQRLERWAERTGHDLDDVLLRSGKRHILVWFALAGAFVALQIVAPPAQAYEIAEPALLVVLVVSLTLFAASVGVRVIVAVLPKKGGAPAALTGVVQSVTRVAIFALGAVVLLGALGVSVTPILTTLGVGGLAVALGLQETLSNVFAGIHLTIARNLRVGDFVKLETGEEGTIEDVGWRATRVRLLSNNVVVVPNSKLAQSVVTNYHLPSQETAVLVNLGVHYDSDLDLVEKATIEVARDVMKTVEGGVAEFDPFIRYNAFGESSIDFTVILRGKSFTDNYLIKHEFIRRLVARYRADQIVIPYPIRALNVSQERASLPLDSKAKAA